MIDEADAAAAADGTAAAGTADAGRTTKVRLAHRIEYAAVRLLEALACALPAPAAYGLGRVLGRLALLLGVRAPVARANLARAFPEKSPSEREAILRAAYGQAGMTVVEHLRYSVLAPAELDEAIRSIRGFGNVAEALARGKGAVLVTGHFGAFELGGAAVARAGHPVSFLVRGQSNPLVDDLIARNRRALGVTVLGHGRGVREALRALRQGGCVALVADQDAGRDGVFVPFFGVLSSTPPGPAEFCVRTGAPLIVGYLRRLPDGRFDGCFHTPLPPPETGDPAADVLALTAQHTALLESWIRAWPDQWLWTHRRWKTRPPARASGVHVPVGLVVGLLLALPGADVWGAEAERQDPPKPPAVEAAILDSVRAGESVFDGAGSSVFPLEPARVRRVFEGVRIRRVEHGWRIDAEEVFQAGVAPATAVMGLPDYRASLARDDTAAGRPRGTVRDLVVTVDGLPMATTELPGSAAPGQDLGGIERLFRFEVPFAGEEIRSVRLEYAVGDSRTDRGEPLLFFYLNPGSLWEGENAKVTVRVDLADIPPEDLIPGWLRPRGYRVYGSHIIWRRGAGDEVQDIALAYRPYQDPLLPYADRKRGPLALSLEAREEWLERLTLREMRFWAAWLVARRGGPLPENEAGRALAQESWFRPSAGYRESALPREERALLERLRGTLAEWDRAGVPVAPVRP